MGDDRLQRFSFANTSDRGGAHVVIAVLAAGLIGCFDPAERDFNPVLESVAVSPASAGVGETLTCVVIAKDQDGDDPVLIRAWTNTRTGAPLGGNETYTINADSDAPGDTILCKVTVSDADRGREVESSASATVVDSPPVVGPVTLSPPEGRVGDNFTCAASATDPDGGEVIIDTLWKGGDTELGSGPTYTLTTGDVPVGSTLDCVVHAVDGAGGEASASAGATILNSAPGEAVLGIAPARPIEGVDDLLCEVLIDADDPNGDGVTYRMEWEVDGEVWAGTADTTTHSGDTIPGRETVAQETWTCSGWASDGTDEGAVATESVLVYHYNRAPVIDSFTLSADEARVGDTVSCTGTASDPDGHSFTEAYVWTHETTGDTLASGDSYVVTAADTAPGDGLVCTYTATDSEGWPGSESGTVTVLNSHPTAPGVAIAPSSPVVDVDDLTCEVSAATDADEDTLTYTLEWSVDGAAYTSTTTTTLTGDTVPTADMTEGESWTCTATANDGVEDGPAASDTVTVMPEGVVALAAGDLHALALLADGTVWAWGYNKKGQLGDGSTTSRTSAAQVTSLTGVVAIGAGNERSFAILADGSLWAWGDNANGELGDGTKITRKTPVEVTSLSGVLAVDSGYYHTVALLADGSVWSWGDNTYGQLGNGSHTASTIPVEATGVTNAVSVDAGHHHSLAVLDDGTVAAWGWNDDGELGDGSTTSRTTAVAVSGLTNVSTVSACGLFSLALLEDGTVWSWGENGNGELGDGTLTDRTTPVEIVTLTGVAAISAGSHNGYAALADGTSWGWGYNSSGSVGDGTTTERDSPVAVSGLTGVTALVGGSQFALARLDDGTLVGWGDNSGGQLGDGTTTARTTYVSVTGLP